VIETDNVHAFHHTRPFWPVHIVVIPKRHINSLLALEPGDDQLLIEIFDVVKKIAALVVAERGGAAYPDQPRRVSRLEASTLPY